MSLNIIAFIFARGGSKGIPRKNIRLFAGKPLIAHAIETAKSCKAITRVVVSTDDDEIAMIARQYGAEVPFIRPKELAEDTSSEWLAWKHAISEVNRETDCPIDVFVSVPTTSPLRIASDIDRCIIKYLDGNADIIITIKKSVRNPYFNMVKIDYNGYASVVIPYGQLNRRQDAPTVYDMTTVAYVAKPEFIMKSDSLFEGRVQTVEIPPERAIDIDTELDFKFAEFLLQLRTKSLDMGDDK